MAISRASGAILLLLLVAAVTVPTVRAVDAPTLAVGDFWTYTTNTTAEAGFDLVGQVTFTVSSRGFIAIGAHALDVINLTANGHGNATGTFSTPLGAFPVTGDWTLTGVESVETSGLKIVSSILDLLASGTVHTDPLPQSFGFHVQNTTTFEILTDTWRYPHDIGDTGSLTARYTSVEDVRFQLGLIDNRTHSEGSGVRTLGYSLTGRAPLATAAGTFDSYRIRENWPDGSYELMSYAPSAGNDIHREAYNATSVRIASADLLEYRYQALEPARFLGLTLDQWTLVASVAVAGAIVSALFLLRWRRRRKAATRRFPPT